MTGAEGAELRKVWCKSMTLWNISLSSLGDRGDVPQIDTNVLVWLSVKQTEAHSAWTVLL